MNEHGLAQAIQALEQAVASVTVAEIPYLTGELERLKSLAFTRLFQKPEPDNGNLLDAQQVAVRLNVPASYVYELARRKELKGTKMGKYVRFTETALKEYQAKYGG